MLRRIKRLRGLGILKDCPSIGSLPEFRRFNLVYGWNCSGKTTLTRLWDGLAAGEAPPGFPGAVAEVVMEDGRSVPVSGEYEPIPNMFVFNDRFIAEHIDWDQTVESILLMARENIDDTKRLSDASAERDKLLKDLRDLRDRVAELEQKDAKFLSDSARLLKAKLQVLDTADRYFMNYNKTKLEDFVAEHLSEIRAGSGKLTDSDVAELTKAARPAFREPIPVPPTGWTDSAIQEHLEEVNGRLRECPASAAIERLTEHGDLQGWVETGVELHQKHKSTTCEFCGAELTDERIRVLRSHFSSELAALRDRIAEDMVWVERLQLDTDGLLPAKTDLYEELQDSYERSRKRFAEAAAHVNEALLQWKRTLNDKRDNPFRVDLLLEALGPAVLGEHASAGKAARKFISRHNQKSVDFQTETEHAKKKLELHYAATEIGAFGLFDLRLEIEGLKSKAEAKQTAVPSLEAEISGLEARLSDALLGADEFNRSLQAFLGRTDIRLVFDPERRGYRIERPGEAGMASGLSEGERTAIAFIYFLTKIRERGNQIDESIVVVDDPVSSFDARNIFHAAAFLRESCGAARQLFVLTHSFAFFKLIRDWFARKNKKPDKVKAAFYVIEERENDEGVRTSVLLEADKTLVNYSSEYHYLFARLHSFVTQDRLSVEEAFLAANMARKLLEAFLAFKRPKIRNDFAQLMRDAVPDEVKRERVYRFISRYSHGLAIPADEGETENMLGESGEVIGDVFEIIRGLDETHYEEMLAAANAD
ncbi:AAA family ATPase [Candidatus Bipolaricaulota bacterium]